MQSVLAVGPLDVDPRLLSVETSRIAAISKAKVSAVSVFVPGGAGGGSGVVIDPQGFALTNFHVSSPAGSFMRCGMSDGNLYDAVIVGVDPVGDLALIKLFGPDEFPTAVLGDSRRAQSGDWCMVIGNPFLLATNLQPSVSWGILSGVERYQYPAGTLLEYADCLQTDAAINPGNSGGPLYDANGDLLGIVGRASFEKRGRVNVGVGYAISIQQAKNFLGYLHSGRIVDHATLGATVVTDPDGGVRVSNILESSDAYRRGLRYSAEILEVDGRPVETANDVQNILATLPNLWRVKLSYRLEDKTVSTLVRLSSVHLQDELLEKMAGALPPPPPRDAKPKPKPDNQPAPQGPPSPIPNEDMEQDSETHGERAEIPKIVAEHYQARRGFANYYFNRLHQQRVFESLKTQFPGTSHHDSASVWTLLGKTDGASPLDVRIQLDGNKILFVVGDQSAEIVSNVEKYDCVGSRSSRGMLPALDAWRRILSLGPDTYGETTYLGTMPLGGERPLRDCLVGMHGELETRWLTHPESGVVEVIEVVADRDEDPAELWITRDLTDLSKPPTRLELRYGTEPVFAIQVTEWKVSPAELQP
jgi:S1-C subfamily serine protease